MSVEMNEDYSVASLARRYAALEEKLRGYHRPEDVFEGLTSMACDEVGGAEDAGVTRLVRGNLETLAPTSDLVRSTDRIQYQMESGPCVDAVEAGQEVYRTGDLRVDPRWPQFGRRAYDETGVVSMMSYRLFVEEETNVATSLNLYSRQPEAFESWWSQVVGLLLATHGALAVAYAYSQAESEHLRRALETNRDIGVAVGILMARHQLTKKAAFDFLRVASQHHNRKIVDLVADVIDTGELVLPAPRTRREPAPPADPIPGEPSRPHPEEIP